MAAAHEREQAIFDLLHRFSLRLAGLHAYLRGPLERRIAELTQ